MQKSFSFNFSSLAGLILLLILGYFLFSIAKVLYIVLLYASPLLILFILFVKKEVLIDYFKRLIRGIRQQPLLGILNTVVSILFLPFTLVGLLLKATVSRKVEKIQKEQGQPSFYNTQEAEYTEYEDISDEILKDKKTVEDWNLKEWEEKFK